MNDRREITLGNCTMSAVDILHNKPVSNAWELLVGTGENPFASVMRACRVEEVYVTGGASDYDKFSALCAVMPQMGGHPLYRRAHAMLESVCGCRLPINEGNCAAIWRACADTCMADGLGVRDVLYRLGVRTVYVAETPEADLSAYAAQPVDMRIVPLFDPSVLLDPTSDGFADALACLGKIESVGDLTAALHQAATRFAAVGCDRVRVSLPSFAFERPHPYRADQVFKAYRNRDAELPDIDVYVSQMIRVLGEIAVENGWQMVLSYDSADEIRELLSYLDGCDRLPRTTCVGTMVGYGASDLVGAHGSVSVGISADGECTQGLLNAALGYYAISAPIGSLAGMEIAMMHPLDVLILDDAQKVLDTLTCDWQSSGLAPTDVSYTIRSI